MFMNIYLSMKIFFWGIVYVYKYMGLYIFGWNVCLYVHIYVCMHACMYLYS